MCLLDAFMIGIENGVIDSAKRTIVFYQFSSRQYYEFGKACLIFRLPLSFSDRQPENEICAHSAPLLKFQPNSLIFVYI